MVFLALLANLVFIGWIVILMLKKHAPQHHRGAFQFGLADILTAVFVYTGMLTLAFHDQGHDNNSFPAGLFFIFVIQAGGFFVVQEILASLSEPLEGLPRALFLAVFQALFFFCFLLILPLWLYWRADAKQTR